MGNEDGPPGVLEDFLPGGGGRKRPAEPAAELREEPVHPGIASRFGHHSVQGPFPPQPGQEGAELRKCRLGTGKIDFVQNHQVGLAQQLVLLQLQSAAVFPGFQVEDEVGSQGGQVDAGLAGAGSFDQHKVEAGGAQQGGHFGQGWAQGEIGGTGGDAAHQHPAVVDGVHTHPVGEQGTAPAAAVESRVVGQDGEVFFREGLQQTLEKFVDKSALPGPPFPGDGHNLRAAFGTLCQKLPIALRRVTAGRPVSLTRLGKGEQPGEGSRLAGDGAGEGRRVGWLRFGVPHLFAQAGDKIGGHRVEGKTGAVDAGHSRLLQGSDVLGQNRPAAAAEKKGRGGSPLAEQM